MSSFNVTVATAISAYLYGTPTPPSNLEDRLRDADDMSNPKFTVNTSSYMASVGRFASPFQVDIVKQFFAGTLNISNYVVGEQGDLTFTLGDYRATSGASASSTVTILQYTTGVNEPDFVERAFIWGTTSFKLADSTIFKIAADGTRSLVGAAMIPRDDENFDFEAGNSFVQAINDEVLLPEIDPYGIGRRVDLVFDAGSTAAWIASKAEVILTADDDNAGIASFFANAASAWSSITSAPAAYTVAVAVLKIKIAEAVEYYRGDHNIVYGSAHDDDLRADGISNAYFDPALPTIFVGGSGDDRIITSQSGDIVYAGKGNDTVLAISSDVEAHGGAGDDTFMLENRNTSIYSGDGADVLDYSRIDSGGICDSFIDASFDDRVVIGADILIGGDKAVAMQNDEDAIYYDPEVAAEYRVFTVDDFAAYDVHESINFDDFQSTNLFITMNSGRHLTINNYVTGMAGISAEPIQDIVTIDIGSITGGRAVYLSYDGSYPSSLSGYRGFEILPIIPIEPLPPVM